MTAQDPSAEIEGELARKMPTRATAQAVAQACARLLEDVYPEMRARILGEGIWL